MNTLRDYINLVESAMAPSRYKVIFVDPSEGATVVGQVNSLAEAKKIIKDKFNDMYDTGDRLRNVGSNIFVLEPEYRNTGELASIDNYKHMYHWIIQPL
jgi:hypothetical protein